MAYVTGTIVDYSNEKSSFRIPIGDITAVSLPGALTEMGALQTAIDNIILGQRSKQGWIGDDTVLSNSPASSPLAQVEWAWLVTYRGNTSQKLYNVSIATADPQDGHLLPNSDMADLNNTDMAAFVDAFEQLARTPDSSTETVTVVRIQLVGRNR